MRRSRKNRKKATLRKKVASNTKQIQMIKSQQESKYVDDAWGLTSVITTGTIIDLNPLAQGNGDDQRIGDKVTSRRVYMRGYFRNDNPAGTPEDCMVRILVLRKLAPDGVMPVISDVLKTSDVTSFYNRNTDGQYKIYYDQTFTMDTALNTIKAFKYSKRLNMNTRYTGTAGGSTTISTNGLYMILLSDIANTDNAPQVYFRWRFNFVDM